MTAQELTYNIAVNLGRLARWNDEGKSQRVNQFLLETEIYVHQLETTPMRDRFLPTFHALKQKFHELKHATRRDDAWAEDALTWANILTHRAKLA